jgi:RHS repeat-associated protein
MDYEGANQGRASVGHPVDVASGIYFTARIDIELPGELTMGWRAFYSTALLKRAASIHGPGWTWSFDSHLSVYYSRYVFFGMDGSEVTLDDPYGIVEKGEVLRDLSVNMELRRRGSVYEVFHWHDKGESVTRYLFSAAGATAQRRLLAIGDLQGNEIQIVYDSQGRFARARQTLEGRQLSVEYNRRGLMSRLLLDDSLSSQVEEVARYEYDPGGRLSAVFDRSGAAIRYSYDESNRMVAESSRSGGIYRMKYDSLGRCIETSGENQYKAAHLAYFPGEQLTKVTDSLGATTVYQYNDAGQIIRIELPNGATTLSEYDRHGRRLTRTDGLGRVSRRIYDDRGNLAQEISPDGSRLAIEYNDFHLPVRVQAANGAQVRLDYDARGNLTGKTDAAGKRTEIVRDPRGQVKRIEPAGGEVVSFHWDEAWRTRTITDRNGTLTQKFDTRFLIREETDPGGGRTTYEYDERGLLLAIVPPAGGVTRMQYDAGGRAVKATDGAGNTKTLEYSPYGKLLKITDALGQATSFEWDSEGRLVGISDATGRWRRFEYDPLGNLTRKLFEDGRSQQHEYDRAGQLVQVVKPGGGTLRYEYDVQGRCVREIAGDGVTVERTYDSFGRVVTASNDGITNRFEYDALGNMTAETQNGVRTDYAYDGERSVIRRHFTASTAGPLEFRREHSARVAVSWGGQIVEAWEFDRDGALLKREMEGWSEVRAYDQRKLVVEQKAASSDGRQIVSRSFQYDDAGRLSARADSTRGTKRFRYDADDRLAETVVGGEGARRYRYDGAGNVLESPEGGFRYGEANNCTGDPRATYTYDEEGRLSAAETDGKVTRFAWDGRSRLTRVTHPDGGATTFGYDALDRRVSKTHNGKRTDFYWCGTQVMAEASGGRITEYLFWGNEPCVIWKDGEPQHVMSSAASQPLELIDRHGEVRWSGDYEDWGGLSRSSPEGLAPALRFAGQYADSETGLHYSLLRYYSPGSGQFISPDPIGLAGGLNEYRYAPNPVNWIDPLGLVCGQSFFGQNHKDLLTNACNELAQVQDRAATYGVAMILMQDGSIEVWVSSAGKKSVVGPALRKLVIGEIGVPSVYVVNNPDANYVKGSHLNDSERHLLTEFMNDNNATQMFVGSSRPVCPICQAAYVGHSAYAKFATALK